MKYINKDDLTACIQARLLDECVQQDEGLLDRLENDAIGLVAGYITGRYDTAAVFGGDPPLRHGVLVQVIGMIVTYRLVRRNAARKVPEDYSDMYDEALQLLGKIQGGSLVLEGLPQATAPDGSTAPLMYGNNVNRDYFM